MHDVRREKVDFSASPAHTAPPHRKIGTAPQRRGEKSRIRTDIRSPARYRIELLLLSRRARVHADMLRESAGRTRETSATTPAVAAM